MDLMDNTCVIFTSDHGFCFGEHGGLFGKGLGARREDGSAIPVSELGDKREGWRRSLRYGRRSPISRCCSTLPASNPEPCPP
jgi:hypothetical protein